MTGTHRRLAPPDRRSPVPVAAGQCPQRASCYCCPAATVGGHRDCRRSHPPAARDCSQPYPANIPPCPERDTLPAALPGARYACCVECGRVTARRWTDDVGRGLPWCAGELPASIGR